MKRVSIETYKYVKIDSWIDQIAYVLCRPRCSQNNLFWFHMCSSINDVMILGVQRLCEKSTKL